MADESEPLEVLSVGIEADIHNLIEQTREGVEQAKEELSQVPPAKITADPSEALRAWGKIGREIAATINRLGDLNLSAAQMGRVIREGVEEGASALQQMAAQILEILSIGAPPMLAENFGLTKDEFQQAMEYLRGLGDQFRGSQVDAGLFAQSVHDAWAALVELDAADIEEALSEIRHSLDHTKLSFEQMGAVWTRGAEAAATPVEKLARTLVEQSLVIGESLGDTAVRLHQMGTGIEELSDVVDYLGIPSEPFVASAEAMEAFKIKINETWDSLDALHDLQERMNEIQAPVVEVTADTEPITHSLRELSNAFETLQMSAADTAKIIEIGSQEGATEVERLAATIAEMAQLPGFILQFTNMIDALKLSTEQLQPALDIVLGGAKAFDPMIQKAVYTIDKFREFGLVVSDVVGLINQGMSSSASAVERTAGTILDYAIGQYREIRTSAAELVKTGVIDEQAASQALDLLGLLAGKYSATSAEVRAYTAELIAAREAARDAQMGAKLGEDAVVAAQASAKAMQDYKEAVRESTEALSVLQESVGGLASLASGATESAEVLLTTLETMADLTVRGMAPGFDLDGQLDAMTAIMRELSERIPPIELKIDGVEALEHVAEIIDPVRMSHELLNETIRIGGEEGATVYEKMAGAVTALGSVLDLLPVDVLEEMVSTSLLPLDVARGIASVFQETEKSLVESGAELVMVKDQFKMTDEAVEAFINSLRRTVPAIQESGGVAEKTFGETVSIFHTLTEQMLHARPAATIAAFVRQMGEDAKIVFQEVEADAKSMLDLLSLGAARGSEIKITVAAEGAVETLALVERALVAANLITQEATHSLEELGALGSASLQQLAGETQASSQLMTELIERFNILSRSSEMLNQFIARFGEETVATRGSIEAITSAVMALSQRSSLSFAEMSEQFYGFGVSVQELQTIIQILQTIPGDFSASTETVETFQQATKEATLAVEELGAAGAAARMPTDYLLSPQELYDKRCEIDVWWEDLKLTGDQTTRVLIEGAGEGASAVQKLAASIVEASLYWEELYAYAGHRLLMAGAADVEDIAAVIEYLRSLPDDFKVAQEAAVAFWQSTMRSLEELQKVRLPIPEDTLLPISESVEKLVADFDQLNITIAQACAVLDNSETAGASWAQMVANEMVGASLMLEQSMGEVARLALEGKGDWEGFPIDPSALQNVLTYLQEIAETEFKVSGDSATRLNKRIEELRLQAGLAQSQMKDLSDTHINPSPLRESIDNIIERLRTLRDQIQQVIHDLIQGRQTRLSDADFMERLGVAQPEVEKSVSLLDRFKTSVEDLAAHGIAGFDRLVAGLRTTREELSATGLTVEQMKQIFERGADESASSIERLTSTVVKLSQASGESFESVVSGMIESKGITKDSGSAILSALGQATGATEGLSGALSSLGGVVSTVLGGILGIVGLDSLKKVIAKLRDAIKETIAFQAALVRLSVGVRAAQRLMGDQVGTIDRWRDQIDELSKTYTVFSRTALTQATSHMILLTREMELNEGEMNQVLKAATTLSAMYQVDLRQAIYLIIQGMTGMSRGLRRYGVFLSRAALNQHAYTLGLRESWRELNVNERAQVALSLITQQTNPLIEDMGEMLGTMAGRMQTAAARTEDAKIALGRLMMPMEVIVKESGARLLEWAGEMATTFTKLVVIAGAGSASLWELGSALLEGVGWEEAQARATKASNEVFLSWAKAFALIGPGLEDVERTISGIGDELGPELLEMANEYGDQIEDAFQDYYQSIDEAGIKLQESLADRARDLERDLVDAYEDYLDDLEDLQREYDRKLADLVDDAGNELEELEREFAIKREKMEADHYEKLLELQEKYEVDSARLHDRFMETLRDAIAKRDAWAALKAIRKYRTDKQELKEDYDLKRAQAQRDYDRRMSDLERQLEEERRKILESQGKEAEDLEVWFERRKEEIELAYDRELEDLHIANTRKEEELQRSYKAQLEDLENNLQDRLVKIARGMADEVDITSAGAQKVFKVLNAVFGLGGSIDQMMAGFESRLARKIEIDIAIQRAWEDSGHYLGPGPEPEPESQWQRGGTMIARRPTIAQFGEVPEIVTFTPLRALKDITQQTQSRGVLEIQVTADEHFSPAFEDALVNVIGEFVGNGVR